MMVAVQQARPVSRRKGIANRPIPLAVLLDQYIQAFETADAPP
jgi:hypothetical protein